MEVTLFDQTQLHANPASFFDEDNEKQEIYDKVRVVDGKYYDDYLGDDDKANLLIAFWNIILDGVNHSSIFNISQVHDIEIVFRDVSSYKVSHSLQLFQEGIGWRGTLNYFSGSNWEDFYLSNQDDKETNTKEYNTLFGELVRWIEFLKDDKDHDAIACTIIVFEKLIKQQLNEKYNINKKTYPHFCSEWDFLRMLIRPLFYSENKEKRISYGHNIIYSYELQKELQSIIDNMVEKIRDYAIEDLIDQMPR